MTSPKQHLRPRVGTINSRQRIGLGSGAIAALLLGLALWIGQARSVSQDRRIGLFTTLPILWNEAADPAELLQSAGSPPHWARAAIGKYGRIVPLDMLAGPQQHGPLDELDLVVVAQPRPLSPAENVALDTWVRRGGRVLLLADPALTQESRFALGDPRRPQAVVLLSPILKRWGLELEFDEAQPFGERWIEVMGVNIPVNLPGRFRTRGQRTCRLWGDGLAVTCGLGKGRLVALADAAVLEPQDPDGARANALAWLFEASLAAH